MRDAQHNITYHVACKLCGAPRYKPRGMPLCKWHHHEYERERHRVWRQKRKAQAS